MQESWRRDPDKLTFIACLPPAVRRDRIVPRRYDAPNQMVGDVNLFLEASDRDHHEIVGEVELMIAQKEQQGKGLGKATLLAFLIYVAYREYEILAEFLCRGSVIDKAKDKRRMRHLRVKIGQKNTRSIGLFEAFGFQKVDERPNYFGEYELRLDGPLDVRMKALEERFGQQEYQETEFSQGS